ncbi:DUF6159 family protein [Bellilinea sp.]|uniref:DUF6159 family protein n=1 Tax=Bellilinea sp. TaxID=2838785 RepID=UPI002ADDD440|nr:DUF6159 family protein [Bellilinea sp.]
MEKLRNSWELVKASFRVLLADKELVVFPIVSAIGTLIVTLTFALPMFLSGLVDSLFSDNIQILGFLVIFLFYIVQYTVIFFANTALVGAAVIRLRGGNPTVGQGFQIAFSRLLNIIGYALIAATVGMILRAVSERSRGLGRFAISLIGFAWNVATFLVVPVLAVEGVGPIEAIKRSVYLLRKTWGEQIAGNIGIGTVFGLISFGIIMLGMVFAGLAFIALESAALAIGIFVLMVIALILIGLINSTLSGVYAAAVYQYAETGHTGGFFDDSMVQRTFTSKTSSF